MITVMNSLFATYEDIFTKFVASKISEVLGISEDEQILLYHLEHSKYDMHRIPSVKEIREGLTFYVITKKHVIDYLNAVKNIEDAVKFSDNISWDANNLITFFYAAAKLNLSSEYDADGHKIINTWFDNYADLINTNEFITDRGTSSSNGRSIILGFTKFTDPTQYSKCTISNKNTLTTDLLVNIYIKHVLQYNIDSILLPITLNNVDVFNITSENYITSSIVKLSDIDYIGIFNTKFVGNENKVDNETLTEFISYECNDFISLTDLKTNKNKYLIKEEVSENVKEEVSENVKDVASENIINIFTKYKKNLFDIESIYSERTNEKLSYTLISTSVTSKNKIDSNVRLSDLTVSDISTGSIILADTAYFNNKFLYNAANLLLATPKELTLLADTKARTISANDSNTFTLSTIYNGLNNTTSPRVGITFSEGSQTVLLQSSKPILATNLTNFGATEAILGYNSKIDLDYIKFQDSVEILDLVGAFIIPVRNNKINNCLSNNTVILPGTFDSFLPVFNGPNKGPNKRGAIFNFKLDKTNNEIQLLIEQKGVPVEIDIIAHNYPDEQVTADIIFYDNNMNELNSNNFIVLQTKKYSDNNQYLQYKIYYNSYNINLPLELTYIVFEFNNTKVIDITVSINYNGITLFNKEYTTYIHKYDESIIKQWKNNQAFDSNGNSEEMTKFLGEAPNVWEQNQIYFIYKQKNPNN